MKKYCESKNNATPKTFFILMETASDFISVFTKPVNVPAIIISVPKPNAYVKSSVVPNKTFCFVPTYERIIASTAAVHGAAITPETKPRRNAGTNPLPLILGVEKAGTGILMISINHIAIIKITLPTKIYVHGLD